MRKIKARVIRNIGTEAAWLQKNPLLGDGEMALVRFGGRVRNKIGNGSLTFSQLSYQDSDLKIAAATPSFPFVSGEGPAPAGIYMANGSGKYNGNLDVNTDGKLVMLIWDGVSKLESVETEMPMNSLSSIVNQDTDKAITPKGVDDAIGAIRSPTAQLIDKSKIVFGYWNNAGVTTAAASTLRTPKIDIKPGKTKLSISKAYFLGASVEYRVFFFNDLGAVLNRVASNVESLVDISIPVGATKWAMNLVTDTSIISPTNNQYSNEIMANYGAEVLPYKPFGYDIKGDNITTLTNEVENVSALFVNGLNLIDKSTIAYGYWNDLGTRVSSTTTISTGKIPIDAKKESLSVNKEYNLAPTISFIALFWDSNGLLISGWDKEKGTQGMEMPEDSYYVSINIASVSGGVGTDPKDNVYVNDLQLEYGEISTPFQPHGKKVTPTALPLFLNYGVDVFIISENEFVVTSYHDNGEALQHHWLKNNKIPQYDNAWRASEIYHNNRQIAQGQFNWIHQIGYNASSGLGFANEANHVGTGHGCETLLRCNFYIDGKQFEPSLSPGKTLKGSFFHFDISSVIYAADSARTAAEGWNGSNVVPKLPLIEASYHYMVGEIQRNSRTKNENQLAINRDNTIYARCYLAMHSGYPPYWDRIEIANIENTMNNYNQQPIFDSTAILNGDTYNTYDNYRGELAQRIITYSDRFGYMMKTEGFASKESQRDNTSVLFSKNSQPDALKGYIQPVVTTTIAAARGIPVDIFNKGDILRGTVYREINV